LIYEILDRGSWRGNSKGKNYNDIRGREEQESIGKKGVDNGCRRFEESRGIEMVLDLFECVCCVYVTILGVSAEYK